MTSRQRKNGVSPRNQNFHEQNGRSILHIVGVVLAVCFWPVLLKFVLGLIAGIILLVILMDLWENI